MYDYRQSGRGALVAVVFLTANAIVSGCSSDGEDPSGTNGGMGGAITSTGGLVANGGTPGGGGAGTGTGGTTSAGGFMPAGGSPSSGGDPGAGGGPSNGGSVASGGASSGGGVASGGASSGGTSSDGGAPASGGAASGGAPASGGASSGGASSGGSVNTGGQSTGGSTGGGPFTSRAIANPPKYMGSGTSSGCNTSRPTLGFEPVEGGGHPIFLYFVGTTFSASDTSARYDSQAAKTITEAMARRGFVSLSVDYDNTFSLSLDKITCMFASSNAQSVIANACKLPNVDCSKGIATWGHSQGALMAHASSQYDNRVRAVWATGYGGGSYPLSNSRLRVVNGEADPMNGTWDAAKKAAGYTGNECPNNGGSQCFRSDGSGFAIVRKADCVTSSADHCWFDRKSCGDNAITLEPNWTSKTSNKVFALEANADWVAATVARP